MMPTERLVRNDRFTWLLLFVVVLAMQQWLASAQGAQKRSSADARSSSFEEAIERARTAQAAGHYRDAGDAYAQAVSLDKTIPELWANLGLMEHLAGSQGDAIASFRRAIALKPTLFTAQLFLGLDELEAGNPKLAVTCLEHARSLRPADLQTPLALGRAYTAVHEPRAAAEAYAAATAIDPVNQNAWYGSGVASISIIEQDGGTLARTHPDSVWTRALYADDLILQGRVDLYRRRMQPDGALLQYDKALALAPHDPSGLLGRAAALLSIGKSDEAIATAGIGLSDMPDDPRLNLLTGEALVARHRFPEAEPFLDRALLAATSKSADASIAALAPRAHALKGRVKAEAGVTDQAIIEMAMGLPSDQDGSLSFQLSRLYRKAGRIADARETEAHAKTLQAQRRAHALTAIQGSQLPFPE